MDGWILEQTGLAQPAPNCQDLKKKKIYVLLLIITMCIHTCMCICTYVLCPWTPEEGIGYPGAGITGGYEPLYMGAGNQT